MNLTTKTFNKLTLHTSIVAGGFSYLYFIGLYALDPLNRNWLYHGINSDPIAHSAGFSLRKESGAHLWD